MFSSVVPPLPEGLASAHQPRPVSTRRLTPVQRRHVPQAAEAVAFRRSFSMRGCARRPVLHPPVLRRVPARPCDRRTRGVPDAWRVR